MSAIVDILLPTYRWNAHVRGYLRYLKSIVEDTELEIRLHIGDNSCNPEKHTFLRSLGSPNVIVHLHHTNIGLYPNLMYLFNQSMGDFVLTIGDDDWFDNDCFAFASFLERNPRCSACAGFFAAAPPPTSVGITCFGDRFMTADPVGRAADYVDYSLWETGVNWLALGLHRRSTMTKYHEFLRRHPFQFYFHDQMLSQIALLTGPVKGIQSGFMFYRNRTPHEMQAHMNSQFKMLENMGLPPWLHFYYDFWLACEYATLYLWREMPDHVFSDRNRDADRVFMKLFTRFRLAYERQTTQYEDHFVEAGISRPMRDVLADPSAATGLRSLSTMISVANPSAGARFAGFLRKEMVVDVLAQPI